MAEYASRAVRGLMRRLSSFTGGTPAPEPEVGQKRARAETPEGDETLSKRVKGENGETLEGSKKSIVLESVTEAEEEVTAPAADAAAVPLPTSPSPENAPLSSEMDTNDTSSATLAPDVIDDLTSSSKLDTLSEVPAPPVKTIKSKLNTVKVSPSSKTEKPTSTRPIRGLPKRSKAKKDTSESDLPVKEKKTDAKSESKKPSSKAAKVAATAA